MWNFVLKTAVASLLLGAAIVAGMSIGNLLHRMDENHDFSRYVWVELNQYPEEFMTLGPGDAFPPVDYSTSSGKEGDMSVLLKGAPSIVILGAAQCESCVETIKQWQKLRNHLKPRVRIIVCLTDEYGSPSTNSDLLDGLTVVTLSQRQFFDYFNVIQHPTILGIDRSGFIKHIQYGNKPYVDRPLLVEFTDFGK